MNRYLGVRVFSGTKTKSSERDFDCRVINKPSSSIACAIGRAPFLPTNVSLRGSSLVATRAPKIFDGIRRPLPLMQGTAHAIVSAAAFCLLNTGANSGGKSSGNFSCTRAPAGSFSFRQISHRSEEHTSELQSLA